MLTHRGFQIFIILMLQHYLQFRVLNKNVYLVEQVKNGITPEDNSQNDLLFC